MLTCAFPTWEWSSLRHYESCVGHWWAWPSSFAVPRVIRSSSVARIRSNASPATVCLSSRGPGKLGGSTAARPHIPSCRKLSPPRFLGVHPAEAWGQTVVAGWDFPENLRPRSLDLAAVAALAGAWWSVDTPNSVTLFMTDRSAGAMCSLHACAFAAAGTAARRPRATLTTPRREALCKVFLVSSCVLGWLLDDIVPVSRPMCH